MTMAELRFTRDSLKSTTLDSRVSSMATGAASTAGAAMAVAMRALRAMRMLEASMVIELEELRL